MDTHRDLITLLGGIRETARKLGHNNHTTVQGWWDRSRIPFDHWSQLEELLTGEGIEFDMSSLVPKAA